MKKSYRTFLFDADDTLFDYGKAEEHALKAAFSLYGFYYNEDALNNYKGINSALWKSFEQGEVTKEALQSLRFSRLFEKLSISCDAHLFNKNYLLKLGEGSQLLDDAEQICRFLKENGKQLYIITNGISATQKSRMENSGIKDCFEKMFISEEIGFQKPKQEFFDCVLSDIQESENEEILIVGDSLTSDIKGGNNAGIDTCWFNPNGVINETTAIPTYEIRSLDEIKLFV